MIGIRKVYVRYYVRLVFLAITPELEVVEKTDGGCWILRNFYTFIVVKNPVF